MQQEKCENTEGVNFKTKDRQYSGQKDKQLSTKH